MDKRRLNRTLEYLQVLDLDAGAGIADVREAYRLQTRTWNPDRPDYEPRVKEATERHLAEIHQAYDWLKVNAEAIQMISQSVNGASNPSGPKTSNKKYSKASGFLYLILIGLLIGGIIAVLSLEPGAWMGPI